VTCRTLTSVFDQDRRTNFCRFLAVARSPSLTGLENLHRSRRTPFLLVWPVTCPRRHRRKPGSGPQVRSPKCPNLSLSSGVCVCFESKAHLSTSAPLSGPGIRPGIRPVITAHPGGVSGCCDLRFPAAFRPPAFASWTPCPARRDSAPHCCRPTAGTTHTRACAADPGRVCTFRTYETRTGLGALSTPGTAVFAGHRLVRGRRLPPSIGRSLFPRNRNPTGMWTCRGISKSFLVVAPCRPFPLPVAAMVGAAPLGFPAKLRTRPSGTGHARHGGDRSNTNL